jgi:hypothetical protein
MFNHSNKKTYGVAVLIITAVLMFILFSVLGLNGISIAAPTSGVLVKLLILLTPTLAGLWLGLALSANTRTATQIVMFLLASMLVCISIGYLRFR